MKSTGRRTLLTDAKKQFEAMVSVLNDAGLAALRNILEAEIVARSVPSTTVSFDYEFFVNEQKDPEGRHLSFIRGYVKGDNLVQVWTGKVEAETIEDAREELFEIFNIRHPEGYANRSMSKGDVVSLTSATGTEMKVYAVESAGWRELGLSDL